RRQRWLLLESGCKRLAYGRPTRFEREAEDRPRELAVCMLVAGNHCKSGARCVVATGLEGERSAPGRCRFAQTTIVPGLERESGERFASGFVGPFGHLWEQGGDRLTVGATREGRAES